MIKKLLNWYERSIYSRFKRVRGITRIKSILESVSLKYKLEECSEGYLYNYKSVNIKAKNRRDFTELMYTDIIQGYIRKREIKEGDLVIDAGAYPGEFTIYAAKKGARKVISLEPDSQNADKLRENVRLNGVEDSVKVIEKGLWSSAGKPSFSECGSLVSAIEDHGDASIEAVTLDTLKIRNGLGEIDFVKMDIEGAEIEAIKGAKKVMREDKPFFSIASYHNIDGDRSYIELENLFAQQDYNVQTGFDAHLTTWAWKNQDNLN